MNSYHDVENKLSAARTQLILDKPFLGALVLRLPMKAANPDWCEKVATDARHFYYNPEYIEHLNVNEVQFVLAHEALHCALSHFARREHRNKFRWDIACDHAINPLLLNDNLTPPSGVWIEQSYKGMTAEEIYPYIDENNSEEPMDKHIYEDEEQHSEGEKGSDSKAPSNEDCDAQGDSGLDETQREDNFGGQGDEQQQNQATEDELADKPPPLTDTEKQNLETQWRQRLAGAAQQAMQAGKLGGEMARMVDHLLQPRLPWRSLLTRYMTMTARDDYTYSRPSRREGNAVFPSLRSAQLEVVVAIDISGSISDAEIAECLSEIDGLKGQLRAKIILLACDASLAEECPWQFEPWDEFYMPLAITGGGGTDFRPVFDYVEQHDIQPDLLVYFTDAEGTFPELMPYYPVIWLVKGKHSVPWGQRVQLN
ncbi:MAG: VWA-like domain-containing protein [Thiotrichaceae bacterium]|nr:VWA-like domain-containing protein [Thiotrichaceae bacterium]